MKQPTSIPSFPMTEIRASFALKPMVDSLEFLGDAGGFSGATFWRLNDEVRGPLVLRLWPNRSDINRVRWIHRAVKHVWDCGNTFVPVPLTNRLGDSVFEVSQRVAELTPWMPGAADFDRRPTDSRLQHTMQALAALHDALGSFESHHAALSTGMISRFEKFKSLSGNGLERVLRAGDMQPRHPLAQFIAPLAVSVRQVASSLTDQLRWAAGLILPQQVVVRDIWHDHVLFRNDEVVGIVDFDALRVDSVSLDLARLLQSMIGNDAAKWQSALDSYSECRTLAPVELQLMMVLMRVNPIISIATWLEWALIDGRKFEDMSRITDRLESWRRLLP